MLKAPGLSLPPAGRRPPKAHRRQDVVLQPQGLGLGVVGGDLGMLVLIGGGGGVSVSEFRASRSHSDALGEAWRGLVSGTTVRQVRTETGCRIGQQRRQSQLHDHQCMPPKDSNCLTWFGVP